MEGRDLDKFRKQTRSRDLRVVKEGRKFEKSNAKSKALEYKMAMKKMPFVK